MNMEMIVLDRQWLGTSVIWVLRWQRQEDYKFEDSQTYKARSHLKTKFVNYYYYLKCRLLVEHLLDLGLSPSNIKIDR